MESVRKQGAFTQHSLIPSRELDFRESESMSQMKGTIHVRIREGAHPFRILFAQLLGSQISFVLWRIDLEKFLIAPKLLIRLF
jgi:hypothetical protein